MGSFLEQSFYFSIISISFLFLSIQAKSPSHKFFNVRSYGAVADGVTDNSAAFLRAWDDACKWKGMGRVLIPYGKYNLNSVVFNGPCNNLMMMIIKGVIKAPTKPKLFFTDHWISFRYINGLVINGGGYLDGQGASAWHYNDCYKNPQCSVLPTSLRLDFVNQSSIHHIKSINSKNVHISIFASNHINISHVRITAPESSPNTDGIHVADSTHIAIRHTVIGTGDDCIAVLSGTDGLDISNVSCGPGHGISIGSLGRYGPNEFVRKVTVRNCTLIRTQNGLRIKTWAPSFSSSASELEFVNVVMKNVRNPIVIDQHYCPFSQCDTRASSSVKISDVKFRNIRGISESRIAVSLNCSRLVPCRNLQLENINLVYDGPGGRAVSVCSNVRGHSYDKQLPPSCL
ncbi:exopolygalacturonase-like [Impatiens glandulifera]|uniref:exopolygalacturonase-like n=1 Tax=Impatiens glandulifera TaxID=253017 RepID=UPI001FB0D4A9|nr:exopolygalacturonase-like [Impatiens glandulifera]